MTSRANAKAPLLQHFPRSEPFRSGGHRRTGAQDRRTGIGRRAGQHAGDALACTCRPSAGDAASGRRRRRRRRHHVAGREVQADVDQFDPAAVAQRVNGFEAAERHGQRGVDAAPSAAPVCTSTPLGMSTATTGMPACVDGGEHLGRGGPQRAGPGDPDDTVDHQIVAAGTLSTIRPPDFRKPPSAFRWVRSGLSSTAAPAAPRRRRNVAAHSASPPLSPEPTTAHPSAVFAGHGAEFARDRGGQAVGGPPHQHTVGQRRQQRCFGFADPSACSSTALAPRYVGTRRSRRIPR